MTSSTVAGIDLMELAASLTPAQRDQLIAQERRIAPDRAAMLPDGFAEFANYQAPRWKTRWRLTRLGHDVRTALLSKEGEA